MFHFNSTKQLMTFHRQFSSKSSIYKKCYEVLNISPESDQETVRSAYIALVKIVHPDSGHAEASVERFAEVDDAFRVLQAKFAKDRRGIGDNGVSEPAKEFDIKHTAPQHRQYLSFDGLGYGSPAQREKQYRQSRASKAYGQVIEYQIDKSKADADASALMKSGTFFRDHAIKTKYGFDRVVEDLIQEAISKGEFNELSGTGKPLSTAQSQNPYVDFTQHKINQILLDNGFTPEWITTQKEIRTEIDHLSETLTEKRNELSEMPLTADEEEEWTRFVEAQQFLVESINQKIDKYNLIVPTLNQQMFRIEIRRISEKILKLKPIATNRKKPTRIAHHTAANVDKNSSILSLFSSWI